MFKDNLILKASTFRCGVSIFIVTKLKCTLKFSTFYLFFNQLLQTEYYVGYGLGLIFGLVHLVWYIRIACLLKIVNGSSKFIYISLKYKCIKENTGRGFDELS